MKYPLNIPSVSSLEKKYVNEAISQNWLSINGKNTNIFEKKFGIELPSLKKEIKLSKMKDK